MINKILKFFSNNSNVTIRNRSVIINGEHVETLEPGISYEIIIEGNVNELNTVGSVTVNGNVTGDIDTTGEVTVHGDVGGDIDTTGAVTAHKVSGSIDTVGRVTVGEK